jgi:hypothetical protein
VIEEELKACITEQVAAQTVNFHLHIKSAAGKTMDKFETKKDRTYTTSTKERQARQARQAQSEVRLAQIPMRKRIHVYLKGVGRRETLVDVNMDWNKTRVKEEFKGMLRTPAIAPTILRITDGNKHPKARFSMTPGYHYDLVITRAPGQRECALGRAGFLHSHLQTRMRLQANSAFREASFIICYGFTHHATIGFPSLPLDSARC